MQKNNYYKQINIKDNQQQQQLTLIANQSQIIQSHYNKQNPQPYLVSSFNQQFDRHLLQLVIEYEFDFDKVALHLYYLYPVYQQKITSRTVALRYWQMQIHNKNIQRENNNRDKQIKGEDDYKKDEQQQQTQLIHYELSNSNSNNHKQSHYHLSHSNNHNNSYKQKKLSLSTYKQALQQSLILQQQQQCRFILYKPKFIIDSQYKLQRYQLYQQHRQNNYNYEYEYEDNQQHSNNINRESIIKYPINNNNINSQQQQQQQQHRMQQILSKMVNNQFVYDQFGGFISNNYQDNQHKQQSINLNHSQQWWQHQLSIDESDSDDDYGQQQFQQKQQHSNNNHQQSQLYEHQQNISYHNHLSALQNNFLLSQYPLQYQQNYSNKHQKQQLYYIDDNWDQYQSD